jgi:RNA polymerase sigma-70 factor, ECF subfamily
LCEDLWRGLPRFEFRCSPRTWIYVLSRHAELRFRAAPHRAAERNLAVSALAMSLAEPVRTATAAYQRSDVQDRFRELRERLSETDELILLLRVDRRLDWQAIAEVLLSSEHESSAVSVELLAREAARLRKRFQLVKAQLRAWATAEGLIEG